MNKLLNLTEVAELTGVSRRTAYRYWNSVWRDYGLKVFKAAPNATPRFEINNVMDVLHKIANQGGCRGN